MKIDYIENKKRISIDIPEMENTYISIDGGNISNIEMFFKRLIALKSINKVEGKLEYSNELIEYFLELPDEFVETFNKLVEVTNEFSIQEK